MKHILPAIFLLAFAFQSFSVSAQSEPAGNAPAQKMIAAKADALANGSYQVTEADAKEYYVALEAWINESPANFGSLTAEQQQMFKDENVTDLYRHTLAAAAGRPDLAPPAPVVENGSDEKISQDESKTEEQAPASQYELEKIENEKWQQKQATNAPKN